MTTRQPPLEAHTSVASHGVLPVDSEKSGETKRTAQLEDAIMNEASGQNSFERSVENEAETQANFENAAKKALNIPSRYRKVAVLILRWHKDIDDRRHSVGHSEEIRRMKHVFEGKMNFVCSEVPLTIKDKPQHILNEAISTHIRRHDSRNNLLIIYYTGHGMMVGEEPNERLVMSATRNHNSAGNDHPATAEWSEAETQLLAPSMDGDVLAILDCCYAGGAHKGSSRHRRTYELLAACSREGETPGPGPTSFTTRLLKSLEDLLEGPESRPIVTTRLIDAINKRKPRGRCGNSEQHDRLNKHDGHIQLASVERFTEQEVKNIQSKPVPEEAVVKLRFSLSHAKLDQEKVENWARELLEAGQKAGIPVIRLDWLKVGNWESRKRFQQAVRDIQSSMKRKSISTDAETNNGSPLLKKRTQDSLEPGDQPDMSPLTPLSDVC